MMPGAGYHYQRSHAVELTLRAACFAGHPNAGVFGGATLLWHKAAYLAPTAGLRLFTPLPASINRVHSRLGLALQATYLLIPRGGAKDQYVTPEIGINWDGATTLYYGHNIRLRSSDFQPFGAHRVALRFSFW